MTEELNSVAVEILGRVYHVRAKDDKQYVMDLAKMIHDKMVAVEQATHTVDSVRVAVLAALNLADDYCKLKQACQDQIRNLEKEREKLLRLVENALEDEMTHSLPDA